MQIDTIQSPALAPPGLEAPAWAGAWSNDHHARLVTIVETDARRSDAGEFTSRVSQAYQRIADSIQRSSYQHIVRLWNHIPGIHDRIDEQRDRYMLFNAARFNVLADWFGGQPGIPTSVPAASGIGHDGHDLVIHALLTKEPGVPIDNPLQIPAYRYSRKYGPLPPCFARATRVTHPYPALLIAGTAAITGEQSRHENDLEAQFDLTLRNLRALIHNASSNHNGTDSLVQMEHVRVYFPNLKDRDAIRRLSGEAFNTSTEIEFLRADLCRNDLLVEIEGIARL